MAEGNLQTVGDISLATAFEITEITGDKRTLILRGRALPYRPLTFSGTMRADVTYYPGNPEPTVQMLGSTEEETTINGMWKDRFIGDGQEHAIVTSSLETQAADALSNTVLTSFSSRTSVGFTVLRTAKEVVNVVDDMRRKGQLVRVTWDSFVREGIITKFEQTWDRIQDVAWTLTFRFLNQGDSATSTKASVGIQPIALPHFASALQNALEKAAASWPPTIRDRAIAKFRNAKLRLQAAANSLQKASSLLSGVNGSPAPSASFISASKEFTSTFSDLISTTRDITGRAFDGMIEKLEFTKAMLSQLDSTIDRASSFGRRLRGTPLEGYIKLRSTDDKTQLLGKALAVAVSVLGVKQKLQELIRDTGNSRAYARGSVLASKDGPSYPYIARQGDDLRKVARITLGNANAWRVIAYYNNLVSSELEPGQRVYIPSQSYVRARLGSSSF